MDHVLLLVAALNAVAVEQTVQVDVRLLTILGGTVVPLLTGLVTKRLAHPGLKALCTLLLSVVAGAIAVAVAANGEIQVNTYIDGITTSFVAAIASYYGFWKPTSIAPRLQQATNSFGIGSNNPLNVLSAWEGSLGNPASTQAVPTPEPLEGQAQPSVADVPVAEAEALAESGGNTSVLDKLKADAPSDDGGGVIPEDQVDYLGKHLNQS